MSCTVTLSINAESTKWGETLGIAGSIPELSTWGTTPPPRLTASPFPIWRATLTLPAETVVHYKYVILCSSSIVRWEVLPADQNRTFTTPAAGETLSVDDGTMDDARRTSATVTPSSTPSNTPTRVPKRDVDTESMECTETSPHALAEFAQQLETSRRHVEHVRASVRRIRRVPTPDNSPTPRTTPEECEEVTEAAAVALVKSTLREAQTEVDVMRQKLRAVRDARRRERGGSWGVSAVCGVVMVVVAVLMFDTRARAAVQTWLDVSGWWGSGLRCGVKLKWWVENVRLGDRVGAVGGWCKSWFGYTGEVVREVDY